MYPTRRSFRVRLPSWFVDLTYWLCVVVKFMCFASHRQRHNSTLHNSYIFWLMRVNKHWFGPEILYHWTKKHWPVIIIEIVVCANMDLLAEIWVLQYEKLLRNVGRMYRSLCMFAFIFNFYRSCHTGKIKDAKREHRLNLRRK